MRVKFGVIGGIEPNICALSGASTENRHHTAVHLDDKFYVYINRSVWHLFDEDARVALMDELEETNGSPL